MTRLLLAWWYSPTNGLTVGSKKGGSDAALFCAILNAKKTATRWAAVFSLLVGA